MPYYYDRWGWHTQEVLPGRETDVAPPAGIPQGKAANWTGHRWVVVNYVPPPPEDLHWRPPLTRRQLKVALLRAGLLDNVESWVAGLTSRERKLEFLEATMFARNSDVIEALRQQFNRTHDQVDALFDEGSSVEP